MSTSVAAPSTPSRSRRALGRVGSFAFYSLALGVLAYDGHLVYRDAQPTPSLATVRTWVGQKRVDEAKEALHEILRRSPNDGAARFELARILGGEKDYRGCAEELHKVPFWWPSKAEAAFLEGQSYKLLNRAKDAEAAWLVCNSYDPFHPTPAKYESAANMELMEIYAYEERWEDAHRVVWNAYEHADPVDHPAILVMRIRTEMERISPGPAAERLRKYVEADPTDWEARLALARAEQLNGKPEEATRLIDQCLKERPDDLRARRKHLEILYGQGRMDAVEAAVSGLPEGAKADPEIWKFRALAAESKQDWEAAAVAYRSALALKPFEPEYHYKLSIVEERLGRRDQAKLHRARNQELRAQRAKLTTAFDRYVELDKASPDSPERIKAIQDLADICDALGWDRVADGWRALLPRKKG